MGRSTFDKTAADPKLQISEVVKGKADIVSYGGTTPNGVIPLVKTLKSLSPKTRFMAVDSVMEQAFLDGAGEDLEGAYITALGMPADKLTGKGKEFMMHTRRYIM